MDWYLEMEFQVAACNTQSCDVCIDGAWGAWNEWSKCTATCDAGFRVRHRDVVQRPNSCGQPAVGALVFLECLKWWMPKDLQGGGGFEALAELSFWVMLPSWFATILEVTSFWGTKSIWREVSAGNVFFFFFNKKNNKRKWDREIRFALHRSFKSVLIPTWYQHSFIGIVSDQELLFHVFSFWFLVDVFGNVFSRDVLAVPWFMGDLATSCCNFAGSYHSKDKFARTTKKNKHRKQRRKTYVVPQNCWFGFLVLHSMDGWVWVDLAKAEWKVWRFR